MKNSKPNPRRTDRPASHAASRPSLASPSLPEASVSHCPWRPRSLRLWAAVGLSTIMLLAIGFHMRRHESPVAPGILFLLAVFAEFGRFRIGGKQGAKRWPRGNG